MNFADLFLWLLAGLVLLGVGVLFLMGSDGCSTRVQRAMCSCVSAALFAIGIAVIGKAVL